MPSMLHSRARGAAVLALFLVAPSTVHAQQPDYRRAEQFLTWNELPLIYAEYIAPTWMKDQHRFWYRVTTPRGAEFMLVDPATAQRTPLFDNARLAAAISRVADTTYDASKLPFTELRFGADEHHIQFNARRRGFSCDIVQYTCTRGDTIPARTAFVRSPDGRSEAFVRANNLFVRPVGGGTERQLTTDGVPLHSYGTGYPNPGVVRSRSTPRPTVQWSPDSRKIAVARHDQRGVEMIPYISMTPARPKLYQWPYALPGDSVVPTVDVHIVDVATRAKVRVQTPPKTTSSAFGAGAGGEQGWSAVRWSEKADRLYVLRSDRGPRTFMLLMANAVTGRTTTIAADSSKTFVEMNLGGGSPNYAVLHQGADILWFSERDGYGHLYRYGGDGTLKNQVTSGAWTVGDLLYVDEAAQWVYFTGRGREAGRNPYHTHLYRVRVDGTGIELLTPENADHSIVVAPSGKHFVDTYSFVDTPPVSVLRSMDGKVVLPLEKADISKLLAIGYRTPEPFVVKARDGTTDLYGVMYKPSNFDSTKKYPVIDQIYPGPQTTSVPPGFVPTLRPGSNQNMFGQVQALAELGFIVIQVDHFGGNKRSKAFHDYWYGNMGDNGLPDHVAAVKQLGARYRWIDLDRVGIYGHSGGGFASTDAILTYPDFYKVAVSMAGNHDNRTYQAAWGEKYQGFLVRDSVRRTDNWENQVNYLKAKNLKGDLFLMHGDMDDNVHPAMTLQVVNALIAANKSFDLLILPDRAHAMHQEPYVIRRTWDYFVRHLLGVEPPRNYEIKPGTS
ncbi:MAG: DPP IV N-terminal domain-containing protein [Cytophagaceae bacterium]|nr:DPP IV N-terminal domain-containing protein [Gemmatimonadaceae bacterium]